MLFRTELILPLQDYAARLGDGSASRYELRLLDSSGITWPPNVDGVWTDYSAFECDFKGYAPKTITSAMIASHVFDGDSVYRDSHTLTFAYDSGESGADTKTSAFHAALVRLNAGNSAVDTLIDLIELDSEKVFTADGHLLETKYRRYALNCEE